MNTLLHKKFKLSMLIFLALSLSAFAETGTKPNSIKKEYKKEYRSLKGACNCYKQTPYKALKKYSKSQRRANQ